MLKPTINKKILKNLSDKKMETVTGVILHYLNDKHGSSKKEAIEYIENLNKEKESYGFHYLISSDGSVTKLAGEDALLTYIGEGPTYINSSLFNNKANEQCISVCIHLDSDGDSHDSDLKLVRLLAEILKDNELTAKDVWRGFDLYKNTKDPLHYFHVNVISRLIKELEKFIPATDGNEDTEFEGKPEEEEDKEKIDFDEVEFKSPFEYFTPDGIEVNAYIRKFFLDNMVKLEEYAKEFQPWDKGLVNQDSQTTGEIQNKALKTKNMIQYQVNQNAPRGTCNCDRATDHLKATHVTAPTLVEPIYPDIITPPGSTIHIADGESSGSVQSSSNTPLTQEEFEKTQDVFNIKDFENVEKETKGRPVNSEDPFPVDEQIKKLEEHFPKVKIDKIITNFDDTNHANSEIGAAMAKNLAMTYDIAEEISKRTEQRLVKIENNLATVMRNLFRMSSRVNINCVYYGGQSVYSKYRAIRCLDDKRIHDGAVVSLDQCLSCTRYEPVAGQIYAILDEAGSNITRVMDDMQMGYIDERDYAELTRVEEYWNSPKASNVKNEPAEKPTPFIEDKWKDSDEVIEKAAEGIEDEEEKEKFIKEYKSGFKMEWNPKELETQAPNIAEYNKEAVELLKPPIESEVDIVDKDQFIDTREDAIEYDRLEFNVDDYKYSDFGMNSSGGIGGNGSSGAKARAKILEYARKMLKLSEEGKVEYFQKKRFQHDPKDDAKRLGPDSNGKHWFDCSSFVETAYLQAGIVLNAETTKPQYAKCKDSAGGELFPLKEVDRAKIGDIVFFDDSVADEENMTREQLNAHSVEGIRHVGIYSGDGKMIHISNPKTNMLETTLNHDKGAFCFGKPADLIALDNQGGESGGLSEQWSREYHGISDDMWNRAKVADGQARNLPSQMKKWNYKDLIIEEAKKGGFDPYVIAAIIAVESNGDPRDNSDRYAGLMQTDKNEGGYGSTTREGMRHNIALGIKIYNDKKPALKNAGWKETNTHVLLTAYNSGEGTTINAAKGAGVNLATAKIPELGKALHAHCAKNPSLGSAVEKELYPTKILRAYNVLWEIDALGLPRPDSMPNGIPAIDKQHLSQNIHPRLQTIQYITIHDTGVPTLAQNCRDYFNSNNLGTSSEYVVDDDNIIEMANPRTHRAVHCTSSKSKSINNHNSIGIEMGLYNEKGVNWAPGHTTGKLHQKTIDNTIELTKMLMKTYGIPKERVVRHYDSTGKCCPEQMSANNWALWNQFKSRL